VAWKTRQSKVGPPTGVSDPSSEDGAKLTEIASILSKVDRLLQEERPEEALQVISRSKLKSPWVTNANGVCLLRLDRAKQAVDLFRSLALSPGVVAIREDVPIVFKTNFATALLASNNLGGCLRVLHEINEEADSDVRQLRTAIQQFKAGLSLWKRLEWRLGLLPSIPIPLHFPAGRLE
jgi:hypothetical protein